MTFEPEKTYFVAQAGISAACQLSSPDSFALGALNNNIFLFSFYGGNTIQSFYAHDDQITSILYREDVLITSSLDAILKFWDLTQAQIREPIFTQYEHEDAILSADLHPTKDLMASVDAEGNVICREVKCPDNLTSQFRPHDDIGSGEGSEVAVVRFNRVKKDEIFVAINNTLFVYKEEFHEYTLKRHSVFMGNIVSLTQDCDALAVSLDNDSLIIWDWQTGKTVDEQPDFTPEVTSLAASEGRLLCATK